VTKRKIYVLDDDSTLEQGHAQRLESIEAVSRGFEVIPMASREGSFKTALDCLEKRRKIARSQSSFVAQDECAFDDADILVIDYDLLDITPDSYLTGESIAYLARCYSRCGLIVGLNQFGSNSFDLTLMGHPDSYADLNIGSRHLDNPGLWSVPWGEGFRPWSWPLLPKALEAFRRRCSQATEHLGDRVLAFFSLESRTSMLPRSVTQFIGKGEKPEDVTFQRFVTDSGNGLRRKDKPMSQEAVARIAAARLSKWLERLVLPGQDVLVAAPHLIKRYPSLLHGDRNDVGTWNTVASSSLCEPANVEEELLEAFRFQEGEWLSRPAWFWHEISSCEEVEEVANPWETDMARFVFCEDVSRFMLNEESLEFVADMRTQFLRRHVAHLDDIDYEPEVGFSL